MPSKQHKSKEIYDYKAEMLQMKNKIERRENKGDKNIHLCGLGLATSYRFEKLMTIASLH